MDCRGCLTAPPLTEHSLNQNAASDSKHRDSNCMEFWLAVLELIDVTTDELLIELSIKGAIMKLFDKSGKLIAGGLGLMAVTAALFSDQPSMAQRPVVVERQPAAIQPVISDRTLPEKRGPEVAPARTDFGDVSIAFRNLARHALPSVVSIEALTRPTRRCEAVGFTHTLGSGFIIDPAGVIVTSSSLVFGAERVRVRLSDGTAYLASNVRVDPRTNVAVLEIGPVAGLPALPLADSDTMQVGDWVMALGRNSRLLPTASEGIVNAVVPGPGVARNEDFFQTNASLGMGSGGGPLLNLNGQVVGISTTVSSWDEPFDRMGLAVPSNLVNWASRQLIDHGVVTRAYLGVGTQPLTPRLARQFNAPLSEGALVNRILPDSTAGAAGVQPGDVIVTVNGRRIIDSRHLQTVVEHLEIGKTYPLEVIRNGERRTIDVTVGKMPEPLNQKVGVQTLNTAPLVTLKAGSYADLGLGVKATTPELIQQAGFRAPVHGVLIESVTPGSPAAVAGLQRGMVIEKVGQRDITNVADFNASETDIAVNNGVLLYVHTAQGPKFVTVGPEEF